MKGRPPRVGDIEPPVYHANPVPHFFEDPSFYSGYKRFHYSWKHVLTGASGERDIWCRNRDNFLELLTYWNRDERWKYWEL
jgi:hypothetical protein